MMDVPRCGNDDGDGDDDESAAFGNPSASPLLELNRCWLHVMSHNKTDLVVGTS